MESRLSLDRLVTLLAVVLRDGKKVSRYVSAYSEACDGEEEFLIVNIIKNANI